MAKVLIAESLDEKVLREISSKCKTSFIYKPDISTAELETEIAGYDGLIVRPKPVSEKVIRNGKRLKLVIRGGAGVNSIALAACKEYGIAVQNTPGLNSDATAEFTILMMLKTFAKRQSRLADELTRKGKPGGPENYMGHELKGKCLGIIGNGNVGQRVAKIAEAFGMEIEIFKRGMNLENFLNNKHDIISLHIPLTAETNNLIGEKQFAAMENGVVLINSARPQLVDVKAFGEALAKGKLAGFAIDGDYDLVLPYIQADVKKQGIITHHIADATYEAQSNITLQALTQAIEFFENGKEINRVV